MSNLNTLLNKRAGVFERGTETAKKGTGWFWYWLDTAVGRCQFCWCSPGTGCAVLEVWGSSGGAGMMCCCSGPGVPGNPGAYSRKYVRVCGSSYICGWTGCAAQNTSICCGGRGNCSVACIFNSGDNGCARSEAGFGGWTRCTTSTSQFCCLGQCLFCFTQIGGAGCGIVCNCRGPNGATGAVASSGDINITAGVSCTRFCTCYNCRACGYEHTLALSPGLQGELCSPCVIFTRNICPHNWGCCGGFSGRLDQNLGLKAFNTMVPQFNPCWNQGNRDCSCYEFQACMPNGPGIPGIGGIPCSNVRAYGVRGGHGAVRITFYQ